MQNDITPELLEKIKSEFRESFKKNKKISKLNKLLFEKKADYNNAHSFANEVGKILAKAFQNNLSSDTLPDGRMYFNIADRILRYTLGDNYKIISEYSKEVQSILNKKAEIGLKGIKPPINEDKMKGIIDKVSDSKVFDEIKWMLGEPIVNFSQSIVDDTVKVNADFHFKNGFTPKIIRQTRGKCCAWCEKLVGVYEYEKVKDTGNDVFRRHRHCDCTVEYVPDKHRRQNIHSKKWQYYADSDIIEKRKEASYLAQVKDINRKDDRLQYIKYREILGKEKVPKSLLEFQKLKYEKINEYEKLKDHVFIQNNFNKGIWKDEINLDKQKRHIKSTAGENKSYFYDDVDIEKLYNEYKMTGRLKIGKSSKATKELINFDGSMNYGVDTYTGKPANGMTIHYSKTGVHLVPTYHEGIK